MIVPGSLIAPVLTPVNVLSLGTSIPVRLFADVDRGISFSLRNVSGSFRSGEIAMVIAVDRSVAPELTWIVTCAGEAGWVASPMCKAFEGIP